MAFVNYNNREITVKIVYYGPALSGKTTCLKEIFKNTEFKKKGKLITLDTDGDRTLFFDFLPIEIGKLGDYSIKIQLYTVPGQVAYNTTRKLVLQGSDGIVFVADSQVEMREKNIESFQNLKTNLKENNINSTEIPTVLQYNKRDLNEVISIKDLNDELNRENRPFFPTIATTGENIQEGLHTIMKMVMIYLKNKLPVFQKDKTVMFSRDEITSASNDAKNANAAAGRNEGKNNMDEEVLELYSPVEIESDDDPSRKSENIFDLDYEEDQNEISAIEVPELEKNEMNGFTPLENDEPIELSDKDLVINSSSKNVQSEKVLDFSEHNVKEMTIPLTIQIPEGNDDFEIVLRLKIHKLKKG